MRTESCFPEGSVIVDLHSSDKYEALRELIHRAPVFQHLASREALVEAVVARERLQSTGLGHGVAVAHGRVEGVQRILMALGVHREGMAYDSPDGEPVRLLFVIASPLSVSLDYLQALSTLVRCLRDGEIRTCLLDAASAREIETRLREAFTAARSGWAATDIKAVVDG
jgi:PTS system nitrogen regulatory IIA component